MELLSNIPQYTHRCVSKIYFCAFLAFRNISNTLLHNTTITTAWSWSHLGGPTQKDHAFKQPLNHRQFGFSFQDLKLLKLNLGSYLRPFPETKLKKLKFLFLRTLDGKNVNLQPLQTVDSIMMGCCTTSTGNDSVKTNTAKDCKLLLL